MKIIILSGKARSGKNEVANILKNNLKGRTIIIAYASYLKMYAHEILDWNYDEDNKPRTFLQEIGDLVKEIDPMFLVNRILEDIEVYKNYFDNIIISDARFVNEIETIKNKYDSIVIRINGKENDLTLKEKQHNTETSLDDYHKYDFEINNYDSLNNLEEKIKEVLEELKW